MTRAYKNVKPQLIVYIWTEDERKWEFNTEILAGVDVLTQHELKHCKVGLMDRTFLKLGKEWTGDRTVVVYCVTLKCNWRERNSKNGTVDKHTCYSCREKSEDTNWNDGKISTDAEMVTAGWTNINTVCNEIDVGFCRQNSFLPRWRKTWVSETLLDCYCQC